MPILGQIFAFIATWFSKKLASIVSKIGFTTFQTIISSAIIGLQVIITGAFVKLIFDIFTLVQDILDFLFGLQTSSSEIISTAVKVSKSIGVWDGLLDALNLVLPFLISVIVIKLSLVGIRLLKALSSQADKVIKTMLSHGV